MRDLIDRQEAIDAIELKTYRHTYLDQIVGIIKGLPSAQIERIRGKWKEHKDYPNLAFLCSECGYFTTMRSHFCPNCGVKMEDTECN